MLMKGARLKQWCTFIFTWCSGNEWRTDEWWRVEEGWQQRNSQGCFSSRRWDCSVSWSWWWSYNHAFVELLELYTKKSKYSHMWLFLILTKQIRPRIVVQSLASSWFWSQKSRPYGEDANPISCLLTQKNVQTEQICALMSRNLGLVLVSKLSLNGGRQVSWDPGYELTDSVA